MKIVSVVGQKGGVGKTTTAMNLAAVTAESSRVLVVDVDPQASATWWAEQAGDTLPFDFASDHNPALLSKLKSLGEYDVIFVDTPGSLDGRDVLAAVLGATDYVVLPTEASALSVGPLIRTVRDVVAPRGLPYRVLLSKVDPRVATDVADGFEMLDRAGIPRFSACIRDYKAHKRAPAEGAVVTHYPASRATSNAIDDYRRLALELFADWNRSASGLTVKSQVG